jgi:hypothetical protein
MAYPDLYKDEMKILEAQNIKVKSVSFNAVLTNRRLILIDNRKQKLPSQEILLATLKNVDSGENAIRDATLTLSIITNTGTTRQMILTFSKTSGGERKRECEEWVRTLRQQISQTIEHHPILPDLPTLDEEEPINAPDSIPLHLPTPRIEIVNAPPQKKRIEISRPMKKIIESAPPMPKPVETSSLPSGLFCNRCGSRVPVESVFCNRCGTPVVKDSDVEAAKRQPILSQPVSVPETQEQIIEQVAVPLPPAFGQAADKKERSIEQIIHSIEPLFESPVSRTEPEPVELKPVETFSPPLQGSFCCRCGNHMSAESTFCNRCGTPVVKGKDMEAANRQPILTQPISLPETQIQTIQQVAVPLPPVFGHATEKKERPIEQVIHSIEPLIEGSIPRTEPAPLVPKPASSHVLEQAVSSQESPSTNTEIQWPVITPTIPDESITPPHLNIDTPTPHVPVGSSGRVKIIALAIIAIVIVAVIAGVFLFVNPLQNSIGDATVPTSVQTTIPIPTTISVVTTMYNVTTVNPEIITTPLTSTTSAIPPTGVWILVTYKNKFAGTVGTPNSQRDVSDTGEKYYQVSTNTGTVTASIQKVDGSSDELTVIIFKDGVLVTKKATIAPKGLVEIQENLKTAATLTVEPTTMVTTIALSETNTSGNITMANTTTWG